MVAAERKAIREAVNLATRARLKGTRGPYNTSSKPLRTGTWVPAIQKVQTQHVFSAIAAEYGGVPD